jgi:hypothetical protein
MAVFQVSYDVLENMGTPVVGQFQEKECGKHFEYRLAPVESWGALFGFHYQVAVGPLGEMRYANVKKTVAYVVIDQDDNGDPIVEKWQIKHIWKK